MPESALNRQHIEETERIKDKQSDPQLVEMINQCIQNDRKAQEYIYRCFFSSMYHMCLKYTRDEDELTSIINDGFLKAFKKMEQFQFTGSFEGWLRRVVFSTLADYFRKKNRGVAFLEIQDNGSSDAEALNKLYFEDLVSYLHVLPEMTKKVFIKYHLEGYAHNEIAESLSISEGTSKWHVFQARQILKDHLTKHQFGQ